MENNLINSDYINTKIILDKSKDNLIDPLAVKLTSHVKWYNINGLSKSKLEKYPIAIFGNGSPVLCLHGFDSSFLEFRRLYPLLQENHKLIIPDLFGFGFCPRPKHNNYGLEPILKHLTLLLNQICPNKKVSIIGASMGGAIAMKFARIYPKRINKLLLLSPAGLIGKTTKIPWPINHLGVNFLRQSFVREELCKQAFAEPIKRVGPAEKQIASLHLSVPGWGRSLAAFAHNGGVADCGLPIPPQPIKILIGDKDRIIPKDEKSKVKELLKENIITINNCGHLPHLDQPEIVSNQWDSFK